MPEKDDQRRREFEEQENSGNERKALNRGRSRGDMCVGRGGDGRLKRLRSSYRRRGR